MTWGEALAAAGSVLVAGWWLTIGHIFSGMLLCIPIIGSIRIANFETIPVSLLGRQIVRIRPVQLRCVPAGKSNAQAYASARE